MNTRTDLPRSPGISGDFINAVESVLQQLAIVYQPLTVTNSFTIDPNASYDSIQANATSGAITVTLSSPTGSRRFRVIKTDASANTVTVSGSSTTINGAATVVLAAQYSYVWVEPTGTSWLIIGS